MLLHLLAHTRMLLRLPAWVCCCYVPVRSVPHAHACGNRLRLRMLMKHLQYESTFCNIYLKQIKHLEHTLATYVYSHYNICNIQIKHLQPTSEVDEIF
jgi:hypothetical protein